MKKLILLSISFFMILGINQVWSQGCMEADDEGVNIIGYIQPQAEYNFLGSDLTGASLDQSDMYFNRMRMGLTGNVGYDWSYYALAELSPTLGGPYILDAYVTYKRFGPWANISMGQFKSPFGLELGTACHKLYTINRSDVVSQLAGPFRDFGVMVYGGTNKWNPITST